MEAALRKVWDEFFAEGEGLSEEEGEKEEKDEEGLGVQDPGLMRLLTSEKQAFAVVLAQAVWMPAFAVLMP